jgi:regulator of sigma D
MPQDTNILDYSGTIDYSVVDRLLDELRKKTAYHRLNKVTAKRIYAIVVECLENIIRYADTNPAPDNELMPSLNVCRMKGIITIRAGNLVSDQKVVEIKNRLDLINNLDNKSLNALFEQEINREKDYNEQGARLGLIMMKLKSGNKIEYSFETAEGHKKYFRLQISVNE